MIFIFSRVRIALLILIVGSIAWSRAARADAGDAPEVEAQRLAHILSYTSSDYAGAVAKGAVVSESEYEEQLSLLVDAGKIAKGLSADPRMTKEIIAAIDHVHALAEAKADAADVSAAVTAVRTEITLAFRLVEAPSSPPDQTHARALYTEHCATCHGQTGRADTARAASLQPHPANFHDPKFTDALTPLRVASTVRFGVNGTAMVPFTFLSDADRWALGFYVTGLRHGATPLLEDTPSPAYTLAELAVRTDAQIAEELKAAGIPEAKHEAILADLRRRVAFEPHLQKSPLALARAKLDQARAAIRHGDHAVARAAIIDAYLEGIEPAEGSLRAMDSSLVASLERRFTALRARVDEAAGPDEIDAGITAILGDLARAEMLLAIPTEQRSFLSTALSSAGILLRESVEAALLIAALLGVAARVGGEGEGDKGGGAVSAAALAQRKRWVHLGWGSAVALGIVTWFVAAKLIALSGASREMIEGVTALAATVVLFFVSYSLVAKREVARWMKFLRTHVSPRRAAASLFGVAFLAAYREAFETILFYQALLASKASTAAALVGAAGGVVGLVAVVAIYSRAGKFAPPKLFYRISSYLLYALAVIFAGQGIAALQLTGVLPIHPLGVPSVPALGLYPTVETCLAQGVLITLAIVGMMVGGRQGAAPTGSSAGLVRSAR